MEKDNPSYYAIIPAEIRYDKKLNEGSKLLYGEITALSNKLGYCYASNEYFANLYGKSDKTISRWVNSLVHPGYIRSEIDKESGNQRRLYIGKNIPPIPKNVHTYPRKEGEPYPQKCPDNITSMNNTLNNNICTSPEAVSAQTLSVKFKKPSIQEIRDYLNEKAITDVDPERFWNYYESNGWRVGRNPMKSWKAAIFTWRKNGYSNNSGTPRLSETTKAALRFAARKD